MSGKVKVVAVAVGLCWCFASVGCASLETRKQTNAFNEGVRSYGKLLRWGYYEEAAGFRSPRSGSPAELDFDFLKGIRITSYDVVSKQLLPEQMEAKVTVSIDYYHDSMSTIHTISDHQLWWYDEAQERWVLDGELPDFAEKLM